MAAVVHLDTHVVAWLYLGERARLEPVRHHLDGAQAIVSPMVVLELEYLREVGRLRASSAEILGHLSERHGVRVSDHPFVEVVQAAMGLTWTRDPFDRLIAAQALAEARPLLTADRTLLANCRVAVWV